MVAARPRRPPSARASSGSRPRSRRCGRRRIGCSGSGVTTWKCSGASPAPPEQLAVEPSCRIVPRPSPARAWCRRPRTTRRRARSPSSTLSRTSGRPYHRPSRRAAWLTTSAPDRIASSVPRVAASGSRTSDRSTTAFPSARSDSTYALLVLPPPLRSGSRAAGPRASGRFRSPSAVATSSAVPYRQQRNCVRSVAERISPSPARLTWPLSSGQPDVSPVPSRPRAGSSGTCPRHGPGSCCIFCNS